MKEIKDIKDFSERITMCLIMGDKEEWHVLAEKMYELLENGTFKLTDFGFKMNQEEKKHPFDYFKDEWGSVRRGAFHSEANQMYGRVTKVLVEKSLSREAPILGPNAYGELLHPHVDNPLFDTLVNGLIAAGYEIQRDVMIKRDRSDQYPDAEYRKVVLEHPETKRGVKIWDDSSHLKVRYCW